MISCQEQRHVRTPYVFQGKVSCCKSHSAVTGARVLQLLLRYFSLTLSGLLLVQALRLLQLPDFCQT